MNTPDLAAALNECMPISVNGDTYVHAEVATESPIGSLWLRHETGGFIPCSQNSIIGILWAECVRRGWYAILGGTTVTVNGIVEGGTDALAFARAFAAAKRAEGGV